MESTAVLEGAVVADHAHHWRIDEAHGPISEGLCKICGLIKPFRNWLADADFITNEEHRALNRWRR